MILVTVTSAVLGVSYLSQARRHDDGTTDPQSRGLLKCINRWTGTRYEDLEKLVQDREQWIVVTANHLQEDDP